MKFAKGLLAASLLTVCAAANAEIINDTYLLDEHVTNTHMGSLDFSSTLVDFTNPTINSFQITFFFTDDDSDLLSSTSATQSTGSSVNKGGAYTCHDNRVNMCGWVYNNTQDKTTTNTYEGESAIVNFYGLSDNVSSTSFDDTVYTGSDSDYHYDSYWDDDHYTTTYNYTRSVGAGGDFSATFTVTNEDDLLALSSGVAQYSFDATGDFNLERIDVSMDAVSEVSSPLIGALTLLSFAAMGRRRKQ